MPERRRPSAKRPRPIRATLAAVERDAAVCRRCDLWKRGTQTVFGAGPRNATIMFVGEQPGDVEDRVGEQFVGPAGRLLRESLAEAGIDAETVYLTNAVKHFKWRERGKRRIHERPNREETLACRVWLDSEIAILKPRVLVALGATGVASCPRPSDARSRKPFASALADIVTVPCTLRRSCARPIRNREQRRGGSSSGTSG